MSQKEAKARIKINKLLEEAGWRLLDDENGKANVVLEINVKITKQQLDDYGDDFEVTKNGFVDFLLLDDKGFPLIVLEAKSGKINPLSAKEQARDYAKGNDCRFIILSNGNIHYLWDLQHGSPYVITKFPTPDSVEGYKSFQPDKETLVSEAVEDDYIALTQRPDYQKDPQWQSESDRQEFIAKNKLKFLRPFQAEAIKSIQKAVSEGRERFLLEMATGTGKTLTSAAVIRLFLRTGNARRVLFLVDRLELEDQAKKAFTEYLKNDFQSVIYKENRDDWRRAEIVVTTVQSLLHNNKYRDIFSPTDFDLVISDEAHRSIGGNSRAVFEYFVGYKLGLTATPKDYLKRINPDKVGPNDQREYERRLLLDTYKTFGCISGEPTFRYSLLDGVKDGYLVNPIVVDARTNITTELLSEEGYSVMVTDEEGDLSEKFFYKRDFEKKFFSDETNMVFCKTFLENALKDPISGEIGKSIIFCVSQNHAANITNMLNIFADKVYPGRYNSDFAVQVTSLVPDAQQFTINFANNNLSGKTKFLDGYISGKTRVCVTVGMMTTGYDCQDILNLCLLRPIFSPQDFVQIKGRGTRKHSFEYRFKNEMNEKEVSKVEKENFKLFDFFANCEYFEEDYDYDQVIELPPPSYTPTGGGEGPRPTAREYENLELDPLKVMEEKAVGLEGMKIDRMFFERFEDLVKKDDFIDRQVKAGNWEAVHEYVHNEIFDKPEEFFTLEKLRKSAKVNRKLSLREILEKIYGYITHFKDKEELIEEEFDKFLSIYKPDNEDLLAIKYFFMAYITDENVRDIINNKKFSELYVNPTFSMEDYKAVNEEWRLVVPEYVKDYVSLNQFMT